MSQIVDILFKRGYVHGKSDQTASAPTENPVHPTDLLATIYRHLQIDPAGTLTDFSGRPVHILESGRPIPELT